MRTLLLTGLILLSFSAFSQNKTAQRWVDSVYKSLSADERIAQLLVVRLSSIDMRTKNVSYFDKEVSELVKKFNIGGICVFQGSPTMQANAINALQAMAKTPILMCIDAEWGLGMRLIDSVLPLPRQMMLGAMSDPSIVYQYGQIVAEQCKRFGMQVNYAPVVDVNNNPNNPVINDRSFGENKYKVASFGIQYMKGMQDYGVMACSKHFPGHGDVAVDSHYDLPVINKTIAQLDSLEFYPFRELIKAGIYSTMVAHLSIPAIDNSPNRATSISRNNVTGLLRKEMGFQGLTFTDALGMKGVTKYFPDGEASVEALIAGNDMLCLPEDVAVTIAKIKKAIKAKKISKEDMEMHCRKVLMAKYEFGLASLKPINTDNLVVDLNSKIPAMRRLVAENALTVLTKTDPAFFPMPVPVQPLPNDMAYLSIGTRTDNAMAERLRKDYQADVFYFDYKQPVERINALIDSLKPYKKLIIGIHDFSRTPANNFNISPAAISLAGKLQQQNNTLTFVFGNPYAIKNFCEAKNMVACYEDDEIIQNTAIDLLQGKFDAKGTLPVTVCEKYPSGSGIAGAGFFLSR